MKSLFRNLSLAVSLWAIGFASIPLSAAPEPVRVESAPLIKDLAELKQLNQKLVAMADPSAAATVCLISTKGKGAGSGVIVDPSGTILSAAHVVSALDGDIIVLFADGKRAMAKALGADFQRDAAMLQITDPGEYPSVKMAESGPLPLNSWCVALGHPGGFDPLRTPPLRLGRVLFNADFLITDCTVVAGDSGGPLFDTDGRLIGIHSNIGSGLNENRHVPIKVFRDRWDDLLAGKRSGSRFDLNAKKSPPPPAPSHSAPAQPDIGLKLGKESPDGLAIEDVAKDSRAAKAGLKAGDVIVKVAGVKVTTAKEFAEALAHRDPQPELRLVYRRDGERKRVKLPVPPTNQAKAASPDHPAESRNDKPKDANDKLVRELMERAKANGGRLEVTPQEVEQLGGVEQFKKLLKLPNHPNLAELSDDFFKSVMAALKPVVAEASASTVTVLADGKVVALGTVVSGSGDVLTKSSETAKGPVGVQVGGKIYPATLVHRFADWDLALFHIDAGPLHAVDLKASDKAPPRGSLLMVPGPAGDSLGIGMVSVNSRAMGQIGFLGVQAKSDDKSAAGARANTVLKDGPAAKAGLKEGDVILSLDGEPIPNDRAFTQAVTKHRVNDTVKIEVLRDGEKHTFEVKLAERPAPQMGPDFMKMNKMSGPLSPKISGFPLALQHDIPLEPSQCGGPLCDLDGHCLGINVARAGRVNSLAIPVGKIAALLAEVRTNPAVIPAAPASTVSADDIDRINRRLDEIQRTLQAIEKHLDATGSRSTAPENP